MILVIGLKQLVLRSSVEVLGLGGVPQAGDSFMVVENDRVPVKLQNIVSVSLKKKANLATARTLDNLMSQIKDLK